MSLKYSLTENLLTAQRMYNGGGSGLKSPRTGTFSKPLTVA